MHWQLLRFLIVVSLTAAFSLLDAAPALKAGNINIGKNLQKWSSIALSEPAPAGDLQLTLTSSDPTRLLLSRMPDAQGTASLTLTVRARFRESPEFWLQALGDAGEVTYTAAAPGYEAATGTVKLSPSGIMMTGPSGERGAPEFTTTPRGWPTKISLRAVRLTDSLEKAEAQYIRGGLTVEVRVESSNPAAGELNPPSLTLSGTESMAVTMFKPTGLGKTVLAVKPPPGFRAPAELHSWRQR
jgi:hypothetical protein